MKEKFRIVSLLLTAVLLMSVYVTPVAASQGKSKGQGRGQEGRSAQLLLTEPLSEEIKQLMNSSDSEIEIVNGSPVVVLGGRNGNIYFPLTLPSTMDILLDGKPVTVKVDGNYLLIPIEGEYEKICISEFDVNVASDGQIVLAGCINPLVIVVIKVKTVGIIAGTVTLLTALAFAYDVGTTWAAQTRSVNRTLGLGSAVTTGGFNFSVPRPLRAVRVGVRITDVEAGETVRVSLVGGGITYRFGRSIPVTGNNVTRNVIFDVDPRDLDTMDILFRNTHGRPSVRVEKTHGGTGVVTVNSVGIAIDW